MEHGCRKIDQTITGGFGTNERSSPKGALTGEGSGEFVPQAFVLAEHKADFPCPHTDMPCGHIGVGSDMTAQFGHETLAKAHHFGIAFSLWIEIASSLASTHLQTGEAVLEGLLEGKEFDDAEIHRRMEPQSSLVGTEGTVRLNPETTVDLETSLVVCPWYSKHDRPFGFDQPIKDLMEYDMGKIVYDLVHRYEELLDSLLEFGLVRVVFLDFRK